MRFRRLSCLVAAVVLTVTFVVPNGTSSALECEPMYVELDVVNGQLSDACASSINVNLDGKISDERFAKMTATYEQE